LGFRTQADLLQEVLENLGVLAAGQTPELEDLARVSEKLPSIVALLSATEVVAIPDIDNIPDEWFIPLSDCVAYHCKQKFGLVGDAAAAVDNDYQLALLQFRVMNRGRPTGETMQSESF
jgi:hypothetical protein